MTGPDNHCEARICNIIQMAVGFTATLRVFEARSGKTIKRRLRRVLEELRPVRTRQAFEALHGSFCRSFARDIRLAKGDGHASYGHAAKMLDVALKVCVHYCRLPDDATAARVRPFLHAAIDTAILKYLKQKQSVKVAATAIARIGRDDYAVLQDAIARELRDRWAGRLTAVDLDDLLWRRLNQPKEWAGG